MTITRTGDSLRMTLSEKDYFNRSETPDVAMRSDGRGLVVWHEEERGILARVIDTEGNASTVEFDLDGKLQSYYPEVQTMRSPGFDGYLVTWQSSTSAQDTLAHYAQLVGLDGKKVGPAKLLFKSDNNSSSLDSVASLKNGNFVVVNHDAGDLSYDATARIFAPSGRLLKQFEINPSDTTGAQVPQVAALSNGNFVIVWEEKPSIAGPVTGTLKAQVYSAGGSAVGGAIPLEILEHDYVGAKVAALSNGGFAVAYSGDDDGAIQIEAIGPTGKRMFSTVIDTGESVSTGYAKLTGLSDGSLAVAWETPPSGGGDGNRTLIQHVGATGKLLGAPLPFVDGANYTEEPRTQDAALAAFGNGQFAVVGGKNEGASLGTDEVAVRFFGVEHKLPSTAKADRITGTNGTDVVDGQRGNDRIDGKGGGDVLKGGAGDDVILGGAGMDLLEGGTGNDLLQGGTGRDVIRGGRGNDTLDGGEGFDKLFGDEGFDTVSYATATKAVYLDDKAYGNDVGRNSDVLLGIEKVVGSRFDDVFWAAMGNDMEFVGGKGRDTFVAANGAAMTGGAGNDMFEFRMFPTNGLAVLMGDLTVTDFEGGKGAGDVLRFDKRVIGSDKAVFAAASQVKDDVVIKVDDNLTITLEHEKLAKLHADDFSFF